MHEMSLALNIVEQTREAAATAGASRILEVEIEVGSLAGVLIDSLRFCLEATAPAEGLAETAFRIVEVKAVGSCKTCGTAFDTGTFFASCPACGGDNVSVSGGQELKIRSLTIED